MGLFDFDTKKITQNDAFMLGMGILGNNTGHYGEAGPAYAGGLQDYNRQKSLQAQQARANQQAQFQQEQVELQKQKWAQQQEQYKQQQTQFQQQQAQQKAAMKVTGGLPIGLYQHQNPTFKRSETPSNIREWNAYSGMDKNQKAEFLNMKRAGKTFDNGMYQGVYHPVTNQPMPKMKNELAPSETPEYKTKITEAVSRAKSDAESESELKDLESSYGRLKTVAAELSDLGKTATYTVAGQAFNSAKRQLGMDVGEGAIARKKYTAKVNNEVLPLLRQTFGAAFTAAEGESLKATLGDKDASPEEKDAVLDAFIESKKAQIETKKKRAGEPTSTRSEADILKQYGL